ncbi:MAG: basic secretory family protein [Actinobacteria bacterium]|nr:basic secretory family protein [Actinomycetota bacterium]
MAALAAAAPGAQATRHTARAAQGSGDRLAAVQAVLDARVAALGSGDRAGWLATVDPQAPAEFQRAQGRSFDGLRSLPLERYGLQARLDDSGDLSAGLDRRYGGAVFLPETRQRMRLRGYDDRDAVDTLWLTFVQRDRRWYVAGDDDLAGLGLDTFRGLWDFGPVETLAGEHLLTLYHPAQAERAKALAAIAEEALGVLRQRWDQPWSERIPLILPGSTEELEKLLQSTLDLDKFVAFVSYGAVRDTGWETTAARIYIQDKNLSGYGRAYQVETLVHELVHAAGAPIAGPQIPAWVHEGVADWIATGRPHRERRPKGGDGRLPRDFEFTTGPQPEILRAYRESRSAISLLASRSGGAAPTALFRALGEAKVAPGSVDFHSDAALRRTAGLGLAEFESGWAGR